MAKTSSITSLYPFHLQLDAQASLLVLPILPEEALRRIADIVEDYREAHDTKFVRALSKARADIKKGHFLGHDEVWK